jgi:site-specific DNA recombinase
LAAIGLPSFWILIERQGAKDQALEGRRTALEAEIASRDDRLKRLYRAIEEGIVDLDGDLKQRIQALKQEREVAQAALDRQVVQARTKAAITPTRLEAFSKLMCEKLDTTDVRARKAYLRSVIAQIEVGDGKIRIFSDKTALAAAANTQNASAPNVRGFVRGWRTQRDSNSRPLPSEATVGADEQGQPASPGIRPLAISFGIATGLTGQSPIVD